MSKKASPALVGAFIVGAVSIAVLAVAILGVGRLFSKTYPFILYFTGDLNGLKVGAPVKFRGVEIGAVTDIRLRIGEEGGPSTLELKIPVMIDLDEDRIRQRGARTTRLDDPAVLQAMIEQGLRGQIGMESLVTGVRYVKLDLFPGSPARLVADPQVKVPEIPTLPTPLEEMQSGVARLLDRLETIDFAGMMRSLSNAAAGVDRFVNAPELNRTVASVNKVIESLNQAAIGLRQVTDSVNGNIAPVSKSLLATSQSAEAALNEARAALNEAKTAFAGLNSALEPESPLMYELATALERLSGAARSVHSLADYLDRNPDALLRGRAETGETP
ncbi:MAG: MlaD family protein [bacterium]